MKKKQENKKKKELKTKTISLELTLNQLIHLRDLMSVSLPPDKDLSVSRSLSLSQKRELDELNLWSQICSLCEEANVAVGVKAPSFIVSITNVPPMGIFEVEDEK
jgi:hypothetical protein